MKERMQGIVIGIVIGSLCAGGSVFAKNAVEKISVNYKNIKVFKDEVQCELKDANGNTLEPFIYNGTTYLPVRPVAELAGMNVSWDAETNTIHLWEQIESTEGEKLLSLISPSEVPKLCEVYLPVSNHPFVMSGTSYTDGLVFRKSGQPVKFNLNYNYETLSFTVGHVDFSEYTGTDTIRIFANNRLFKEFTLRVGDEPQRLTIPVRDVNLIEIRVIGDNNPTHDSVVGIGDIMVK